MIIIIVETNMEQSKVNYENLEIESFDIIRELKNRRRIDIHISCMIEEHIEHLQRRKSFEDLQELIRLCRKAIYEVDQKDKNHIIKSNYIIFKDAINLWWK